MLLSMTGTDMIHVPYKGSAPAVADVMGGRVTMMLPGIGSAINLAKEGKLKGACRLDREARFGRAGHSHYRGIRRSRLRRGDLGVDTGARRHAAGCVARLNTAIREVVAANELRQKMINLGFEPDATKSPAEAAHFIRSEREKWGKLVRERNIRVE